MPIITSIKAQKNQKRVNINIDGSFGFGLDLENFMKLQLKVNQELTQEEIESIIKKGELQKSLDKTLRFSMVRPRSTKEVLDYFRRKEIDKSIQETIIEKIKKLDLLDDEKFARWWVEQRLLFRNKSKKDISFELQKKGIKSSVIKNVLEDAEIDEKKIALQLVNKKMYKWQKFEDKVRKQKITQYLAGKGFNWDVISNVIENID